MARRTRPVEPKDFSDALLDPLERAGKLVSPELDTAHITLRGFFRADNFAGAVEYATKELGIDIEKVRKAWNGW